jgi:hypothetical protein
MHNQPVFRTRTYNADGRVLPGRHHRKALERSSAAAQGSQPDASQWKSHRSAEWGFDISVPPDWVKLNMPPMGNQRMTLRRKINPDNTKSVRCAISASNEPEMAGMSQQQINELMLRNGPPSIQQLQAILSSSGFQYEVQETSLGRIMGLPVYQYRLSASLQSMDVHDLGRDIMVSLYIPGRTFIFNCGAWANNERDVNELYAQWLPTLRRILSTIVIY